MPNFTYRNGKRVVVDDPPVTQVASEQSLGAPDLPEPQFVQEREIGPDAQPATLKERARSVADVLLQWRGER